jgi:3-methyladenine DNA glycosylase AlkD/uncharacterized protein YdeI (YjbR/CyaY-like superfamily)
MSMTRRPEDRVQGVLDWLKRQGTKRERDAMARYAIPSDKAFGVSVGRLKQHAKRLGPDHELAAGLWDTDRYEARMLASMVDEPARVTAAQMDRWCREFDNWAICDTVCFHLFDRTPYAFAKVKQWAGKRDEYVKRAAFALLWGLTVHDKGAGDEPFVRCLPLVERAAADGRHFVKKAVNMALRAIGKRSPGLNAAAVAVARRLAASPDAAPRWVGKDALRELTGPSVTRRLAAKRPASDRRVAPVSPRVAASRTPTFFPTPAGFRAWLTRHAASSTELIVGFYKSGSGKPSLSWSESVDEALCFGWIDGVRKRIDDESYQIRFAPRKPGSTWSAINIDKAEALITAGRMKPAGLEAFARRSEAKSRTYSYEQSMARLGPADEAAFKKKKAAWTFLQDQAPSYRKMVVWWVVSAKQEATRQTRLAKLIEASKERRRL